MGFLNMSRRATEVLENVAKKEMPSGSQLGLFGEHAANSSYAPGVRFKELRDQVIARRTIGRPLSEMDKVSYQVGKEQEKAIHGTPYKWKQRTPTPVVTPTATTQPLLGNTTTSPSYRPSLDTLQKENTAIKTKAANEEAKGAWSKLGTGLSSHMADMGKSGFNHQMVQNITIGGGAGLVGGLGASASAAIDPEHFQSNGIIKPALQGAFKGAMLGAAHAAGSSMTRAAVGTEHSWINRTGRMVQSATQHRATKGALAMVALADGGNTNFTKPSNPLR